MASIRSFNEKYADNAIWQFVKFNLVSLSVSLIQLILANILPLVFNGVVRPLPKCLHGIFDPDVLFEGPSEYVVNGIVTWGYVIPFFLSNLLANIYGYFVNMRDLPRKGNTGRPWPVYFCPAVPDPFFHLASGMDHSQALSYAGPFFFQNSCSDGGRPDSDGGSVSAGEVRAFPEQRLNRKLHGFFYLTSWSSFIIITKLSKTGV
jgi:hypothetical protein